MAVVHLSAAQAAREAGVSRPTIARAIEAGRLPGAYRDQRGHWRIPVPDLLGAGFQIGKPSPPDEPAHPAHPEQHAGMPRPDDERARLHAQVADLRVQVEQERAGRIAAEALAAERLDRIGDLQRQLPPRAIEGGRRRGLLGRLLG